MAVRPALVLAAGFALPTGLLGTEARQAPAADRASSSAGGGSSCSGRREVSEEVRGTCLPQPTAGVAGVFLGVLGPHLPTLSSTKCCALKKSSCCLRSWPRAGFGRGNGLGPACASPRPARVPARRRGG